MEPDKIDNDVVVTLQYRLSLDGGNVLEETEADDPLMYLHGHDNIISGLEEALTGLTIGDEKKVVIEPEDGYGERDDQDLQVIPRDELPPEIEPEVGMLLGMEDQDGHQLEAEIVLVESDTITLDFNHPLAGKRLHFEVTITDLRVATQKELDHGHVHIDDHHHH